MSDIEMKRMRNKTREEKSDQLEERLNPNRGWGFSALHLSDGYIDKLCAEEGISLKVFE